MFTIEWKLGLENPVVRGATFLGALASLIVSTAVKELAAYVLLIWALLLFFRVHQQEIFSLWVLYGFAYWSLGTGQGDSNILLTLVSSVIQLSGKKWKILNQLFNNLVIFYLCFYLRLCFRADTVARPRLHTQQQSSPMP